MPGRGCGDESDDARARRRGTHERYETGRKGFELKTSDSRNLCSRSHDIGLRGGASDEDKAEATRDGDGWRAAVPHLAGNRRSCRRQAALHGGARRRKGARGSIVYFWASFWREQAVGGWADGRMMGFGGYVTFDVLKNCPLT